MVSRTASKRGILIFKSPYIFVVRNLLKKGAFGLPWKKLIYSLLASQLGAQKTSFSGLPDWVLHGIRKGYLAHACQHGLKIEQAYNTIPVPDAKGVSCTKGHTHGGLFCLENLTTAGRDADLVPL